MKVVFGVAFGAAVVVVVGIRQRETMHLHLDG